MGLRNLIDYFDQQSSRSKIADFAAQQYGANSPQAMMAQVAPEQFIAGVSKTMFDPNAQAEQQQQKARMQLADPNNLTTPDAQGITWDAPRQQPGGIAAVAAGMPQDADSVFGQQQQPSALDRMAAPEDNGIAKKRALMAQAYPKEFGDIVKTELEQEQMFGPAGSEMMGGSGPLKLEELPPNIAPTVKSMLEGRQATPSSFAMKSPYWQQMMNMANRVDPNFDQTIWQQRNKAVQSVVSPGGADRKNINSIETAINHLAQLQDANKELGGWGSSNELVRNPIMRATNDTRIGKYETIAKTAADEVAKATAGPGGSTQDDRKSRYEQLSPDQSPEVRQKNIEASIKLLMGRLEPVASSFNAAMGKALDPVQLLSPETQKSYAKIMGLDPEFANAEGNYQAVPRDAQPAQASSTAAPAQNKDAIMQELKRRGLMK